MTQRSSFWADWLAGISLANLCFLRVWSEILTYSRADTYWMKNPPSRTDFSAAMANVLLWGTVFGLLLGLLRRAPNRVRPYANAAFLLVLAVPINAVRGVLSNQYTYLKSPLFDLIGQRGVLLLAVTAALAAAVLVFFFHNKLASGVQVALRILSPLVAFTFLQAGTAIARYDARPFAYQPFQPLIADARPFPRVVWIIFDEWDYRLTFLDRQPGLSLPAVDKLRSQSFFALNANPPGPATPISMPGLITGRLVDHIQEKGTNDLELTYRGEHDSVRFGDQPNFFDEAHKLGINTALLGWYHPYCRVIGHSLSSCDSWEMGMQHNSMGQTFLQILPNQARSLFETNLFSPFGQSLPTQQQAGVAQTMLARGKALIVDTRYSAILMHFGVPHGPHSYDRKSGTFTLANSPIQGYWDSLALQDRFLGELRQALEDAGLWDQTTLVASTDHHYREDSLLDGKEDLRIPFIMKLAGQKAGVGYQPAFNTILTKNLLLSVLRGEISDAAALGQWMDAHSSHEP